VASDRTILVFGDSLSAAYGIRPEQGWVPLLVQRLHSQGYGYQFLLDKVALNPALMQEDGLHPNAAGEPLVLDTLWPYLKPLLKKKPPNGGR